MKKIKCRNYVKMVMVVLAAGLLTYACKREYDIADVERPRGNKELSASAARQWFERNYKPIVGLSFGSRTNSDGVVLKSSSGNPMSEKSKSEVLIKPNWDRPKEGRKGNIEVVEISATSNRRIFIMDEETKSRRTSSDGKSMRNTARVVIHKNLRTGKTRSFLMVFVGTYDYLKSSNNIAKNSYFKRDPNFEGDVMFYNLDGSLINGWRYRNKKIVARITPAGSKTTALNARMQTANTKKASSGNARMAGGYWDCWTDPIYYEEEVCEQEGYEAWDEELGWGAGVDYSCHTETQVDYRETCFWVDDPYEDEYDDNNPNYPDPGYVDPEPEPQPTQVGDREPTTYVWRDKLSNDMDAHLTKTTPLYITNSNGELVGNPNAFNCHYHTFNTKDPAAMIGSMAADGAPKWITQVNLVNWNEINHNIQVGDIIMYYGQTGSSHGWTHSGIVTQVDAQGYATEISSKMGEYQVITHHPRDIPEQYGSTAPEYTYNGQSYPSRIYFRKK